MGKNSRSKPQSMVSKVRPARPSVGVSRPDLVVLDGIRQIIHAMDLHSRVLSSRYGVTGPQFACLYSLLEEGAMSQKELGAYVHVGGSTITGIIDRLETKGLVQRLKDTVDRRRSVVKLTPKGKTLIKRAPSPLQDTFAENFGKLSADEQVQIAESVKRIVDLMEAEQVLSGKMSDDANP